LLAVFNRNHHVADVWDRVLDYQFRYCCLSPAGLPSFVEWVVRDPVKTIAISGRRIVDRAAGINWAQRYSIRVPFDQPLRINRNHAVRTIPIRFGIQQSTETLAIEPKEGPSVEQLIPL
jgi:hypothetical protein